MGGAKTDGQVLACDKFNVLLGQDNDKIMTVLSKRQSSQFEVTPDGKSEMYKVDISPKHRARFLGIIIGPYAKRC